MSRLLNYFLRGLVIVGPLALTIYVCVLIFTTIDNWLGFRIPGAGFVVAIVLVTLIGFVSTNLFTIGLLGIVDHLVERLPFVRLLYSSAKDMLNAFVGEKRRFDKPALVSLSDDGAVKVFAFITSESLATFGIGDSVSVYMPQSYGFAGHILVVPGRRVERINADAAEVMAFILSGGVTEVERKT